MKRVIINTANFKKGGALQVAVSFVHEASKIKGIQFCIVLGKETSKIIDKEKYNLTTNMLFRNVLIHPSDSLLSIFKFRNAMSHIEREFKPNSILSIFGPCYWRPNAKHIMGFANGYLLYEDGYFFNKWKGWKTWKYKMIKRFQVHLLKNESDYYWTETEDSKIRLSRLINKPQDRIIVSGNNCSNIFWEGKYESLNRLPPKTCPRLLYISSYYYHKGFEIIPNVLKLLEQKGYKTEMVLTLEQSEFEKLFKGIDNVINLGSIDPKYCPWLYEQADIVFAPTLLEIFSAVYPEAMYMRTPILTSDLPFAKSICEDAALYFKPESVEDAVEKLILLLNDKNLCQTLVSKGIELVSKFELPQKRIIKILEKVLDDTVSLDDD